MIVMTADPIPLIEALHAENCRLPLAWAGGQARCSTCGFYSGSNLSESAMEKEHRRRIERGLTAISWKYDSAATQLAALLPDERVYVKGCLPPVDLAKYFPRETR